MNKREHNESEMSKNGYDYIERMIPRTTCSSEGFNLFGVLRGKLWL